MNAHKQGMKLVAFYRAALEGISGSTRESRQEKLAHVREVMANKAPKVEHPAPFGFEADDIEGCQFF